MESIYIFSQNQFKVIKNNTSVSLINNQVLKISNLNPLSNFLILDNYGNTFFMQTNNLKSCNNFAALNFNGNLFVNFVATNFNNLKQKITTTSAEVYIYDLALRLIFNGNCYTYGFNEFNQFLIKEVNEYICIFNSKILILFNIQNHTFITLNVQKYQNNSQNIEILCEIPYVFNYFLFFKFAEDNNNKIKKLKNQNQNQDSKNLIYELFYLTKLNFSDAELLISNNINFQNLKDYFAPYQDIVKIEDNYYLFNSQQIVPIHIKTYDNKITEID